MACRAPLVRIGVLTFFAFAAGAARAGVLEEVRVTSHKREQPLHEVPATLAVFDADYLQNTGVENITHLQSHLPGLSVQQNRSPFASALRIRGIGNEGNIPNFEPDVAFYIDGAFRARTGLGMGDLVEIERIEVLKGPQSTLYGRNATAGVINVVTPGPDLDGFSATGEITLGRFDETAVRGSVTGPLTEHTAYRLSLLSRERDGWMDNTAGADPNADDQQSLRAQLLFRPSESLSLRMIGSAGEQAMTCCSPDTEWSSAGIAAFETAAGSPPADADGLNRRVALSGPHRFDGETGALTALVDADLGFATLASVSSYDDYDYTVRSESSYSELELLLQDDRQRGETVSQELRLISPAGAPLQWLAGMYYLDTAFRRGGSPGRPILAGGADWPLAGPGLAAAAETPLNALIAMNTAPGDNTRLQTRTDTESASVFGRLGFAVHETLTLAAGARYLEEDKDFSLTQLSTDAGGTPLAAVLADADPANDTRAASLFNLVLGAPGAFGDTRGRHEAEAWTWDLNATWELRETLTGFATASRGFKSGGFNGGWGKQTLGDPALGLGAFLVPERAEDRRFDDEHVRHYELGVKSEWLDRRLRLNAAVFRSDYQDLQVASFNGLMFVVTNADKTVVEGLEFDGAALVGEHLTLHFAGTFLDGRYRRFETGTCLDPDTGLQGSCTGRELLYTPDYELHLGAGFEKARFYARVDLNRSGDYRTSDMAPGNRQPAFTTADARLGWRSGALDMSLWGRNLTDETVQRVSAPQPLFSGVLRYLNEPRTYGVTARVEF